MQNKIKNTVLSGLLLMIVQQGWSLSFDECVRSGNTPLKLGNGSAQDVTLYYTNANGSRISYRLLNGGERLSLFLL